MNTKSMRRTYISLVAAAAALAGVAACGPGGGSDKADGSATGEARSDNGVAARANPVAALLAVQKKTSGARSAKVEGTMTVGSVMGMTMNGKMAWADGMTGLVDIKYTSGAMAQNMRKIGGDGTIKARYLSDAYYADMGDSFARSLGGKHWIRYGYDDMAKLMGPSGAVMKDQMRNSTPEEGVKALLASGDVRKVGAEDVRGVPATHYSGTVDVAKLAATQNSGLDAKTLEAFKAQLQQAGVTTESVDIWVDKNDLLVKKTERGQMKTGELDNTVYYSDYGVQVEAQAPAASDTVDFKSMIGQAPKSSTA